MYITYMISLYMYIYIYIYVCVFTLQTLEQHAAAVSSRQDKKTRTSTKDRNVQEWYHRNYDQY